MVQKMSVSIQGKRIYIIILVLFLLIVSCNPGQSKITGEVKSLNVNVTKIRKQFENIGFNFVSGDSSSPSVVRIVGDSQDGASFLHLDSVNGHVIGGSIWITFTNNYERDVRSMGYIELFIENLLPQWRASEEWMNTAVNEIYTEINRGKTSHDVSTTVNGALVQVMVLKQENIMSLIIEAK